jgi:tetratricopeptide (TPR) repeat protein
LLREKSASALPRAVLKLRLNALTDGVKDVNALFGKAIESRSQAEQKLLTACAVCVPEGFWLPLAAEIAELSGDEAEDAADPLVHSSLLRVVDRDRRRFNLHALLRDQLRARLDPDDLATLRKRHTASLERLFKDWQTRWQDCRECLEEIIPAAGFLWQTGEGARESWLTYWGYALGLRVGELDAALRILQQHESFWTGRDDREAKNALQASYGNQALILQDWGRLEEALALLKKQEVICLELGNKDSLQRSYGNQALILKEWGRLDEARALYKQQEVICLELGNKDSLQITYGNQALILKAWGRLEEAMALHKKEEAICLELGNKDSLQRSYGNQAGIFHLWGRLEEAMALYKQQEAICLELGNKYGLQKTYGNQALILINQDRLNEALVLLQKSETICIELGLKKDLGYCYWQRASLAHTQGDRQTAKEKLKQALAIFTELKMPRERDAVQANLDILSGEAPD